MSGVAFVFGIAAYSVLTYAVFIGYLHAVLRIHAGLAHMPVVRTVLVYSVFLVFVCVYVVGGLAAPVVLARALAISSAEESRRAALVLAGAALVGGVAWAALTSPVGREYRRVVVRGRRAV